MGRSRGVRNRNRQPLMPAYDLHEAVLVANLTCAELLPSNRWSRRGQHIPESPVTRLSVKPGRRDPSHRLGLTSSACDDACKCQNPDNITIQSTPGQIQPVLPFQGCPSSGRCICTPTGPFSQVFSAVFSLFFELSAPPRKGGKIKGLSHVKERCCAHVSPFGHPLCLT